MLIVFFLKFFNFVKRLSLRTLMQEFTRQFLNVVYISTVVTEATIVRILSQKLDLGRGDDQEGDDKKGVAYISVWKMKSIVSP